MRSHTKKARRVLTVFMAAALAVTFLLPVGASASYWDPPWDQITGILRDTMNQDEFYWDLDQPPLACKSDADEDGIWELVTVYPVKWAQDPTVWMYCKAWLINAWSGEVTLAQEGAVYYEEGSSNGDVSLVEKDGKLYVMTRSIYFDGGDYHENYHIETLNEGPADEGWDMVLLFANGTFGADDLAEYWYDTAPITQREYQDYLDEFDVLYTIDPTEGEHVDEDFDILTFNTLLM